MRACATTFQMPYDAPEHERRQGDRQEHAQRAEERDDLQDDHEELRAVRRELDLRRADALARVDRLEGDVVARLDERQRRRRRRRESVGQEMEELEQMLAARRPEPGREIVDPPSGEIAGEGIEQRVAGPPRQRRLRAAVRAPITRSYSPSRRTSRSASAGAVLAVAVDDQHVLAGRRGGSRSSPPRHCPCCTDAAPRLRPRCRANRLVSSRRPVVDDDHLAPRGRAASARTTSAMAAASLYAGITTETESGCATQSSCLPRTESASVNRREGCAGAIRSRGGS